MQSNVRPATCDVASNLREKTVFYNKHILAEACDASPNLRELTVFFYKHILA